MAKILCIEDEDFLRQDIVEELTDAGYDVIEADNGADGLKAIIAHSPDLVLCDITMPVMDGRTLLTELRDNHPYYADLPFVFLTALADRTDVIAGKKLGADDYLTKPIDFEMLLATIESRLRQIGRMIERKDEQMIKLYKALSGATDDAEAPADRPDAETPSDADAMRLVLVGGLGGEAMAVTAALRDAGYRVVALAGAPEFLDRQAEFVPDLLLVAADAAGIQDPPFARMLANAAFPKVLLAPRRTAGSIESGSLPGVDAIVAWSGDIDALDDEIGAIGANYVAAKKFAAVE